MKKSKENVRLDAVMKMLFNVSKPLVIRMINYFFNENLSEDEPVEIEYLSNDMQRGNDIAIIRTDMLLEAEKSKHHFHIEFQTDEKGGMILRMLEYGFGDAIKNAEMDNNKVRLYFPKQVVMYLERAGNIPEKIEAEIVFPTIGGESQTIRYMAGIVKAWEITREEKLSRKLYSLLPLEIFKLREKVKKVRKSNKEEYRVLAREIKDAAILIIDEALILLQSNEITERDYHKIMQTAEYFLEYFTRNYEELDLGQEVKEVETYLTEVAMKIGKNIGLEEGREEEAKKIAKALKEMGVPTEVIKATTGIDVI